MKQKENEKAFFYLGLFGFVFFVLADLLMVYDLRLSGGIDWINYIIFGVLWALGLVCGGIAAITHLSIFHALSAAFYWTYFALFGIFYGTVHQALSGIVGDSNASTAAIALELLAWVGVILIFLAIWLRKRPLLIASLVVQGVLSFFYIVEFFCTSGNSFGLARTGFVVQFSVVFESAASALVIAAILVLHLCEIVQTANAEVDVEEAIREAENHENDFDPNPHY